MYEWLTKITITCFAASYLVTLVLEISRLFFRAPIRLAVMLAFAVAGLLAQTAYLIVAIKEGADRGLPLSRWYDWCLLAAWVLAAIYIVYTFRRPKSVAGLFLLPVILILILLAEFFFGPTFPAERVALLRMGQIHGVGILLGTVMVILGFVAGLMYLAQSYRLKRKLPRREGLKLPSLEWLQRVNRRALSLSSIFIAGGLIAGVILNLINHRVPWTEPLVIMSGVLLLWLIVAMLFEYLYKPAREGRKVAYLTIASFIFLGLVLSTVFFDFTQSHGRATPRKSESKSDMSGELSPTAVTTRTPGGEILEVAPSIVPKGRQSVAWGVSPRKRIDSKVQAPSGRHKSRAILVFRPSGALLTGIPNSLGLTPQATRFRRFAAKKNATSKNASEEEPDPHTLAWLLTRRQPSSNHLNDTLPVIPLREGGR